MSTQHPDNVSAPFFAENEILSGNKEVMEAFYVFSRLGCREQMWDCEGKEVDIQVVEKLLSQHTNFFSKNILGKNFFLTYRVPNPSVEKNQGKILLEVLHSIPRTFDSAKLINQDIAPVFEVILPMATNSYELKNIKTYYEKAVVAERDISLSRGTVKDWVGDVFPRSINVIPLFEDYNSLFNADKILEEFLSGENPEYQRVFLARSDPALNYGSVSAVLMLKRTLMRIQELEEKVSIPLLPILGVGSSPFRGNFTPLNIENCTDEYPSVQTFTLQSAFKYDYPFRDVINSVDMLNSSKRGKARDIEEEKAMMLFEKIKNEYQKQLIDIATLINAMSKYIPSRRARKLHVGLFGYSRSLEGISLPRAIKFCASFYSIGLPPEILGLSALNEKDFSDLNDVYIRFEDDIRDSLKYLNRRNLALLPKNIREGVEKVLEFVDYEENPEYCEITEKILKNLLRGDYSNMKENVEQAAWLRKFLG